MLDFFRKPHIEKSDGSEEHKPDKRLVAAIIILAVFVAISLVAGIFGGSFKDMDFGFRFHFSDIAALVALAVAYMIYRLRKGGSNHGG